MSETHKNNVESSQQETLESILNASVSEDMDQSVSPMLSFASPALTSEPAPTLVSSPEASADITAELETSELSFNQSNLNLSINSTTEKAGRPVIEYDGKFTSFAQFEEVFNKWKDDGFHPFRVASSETLRDPSGVSDLVHKYRYVVFHCAHYGNPRVRGTGKRPCKTYLACGCQAVLRLNYKFTEKALRITTLNIEHNHPTNSEYYALSQRSGRSPAANRMRRDGRTSLSSPLARPVASTRASSARSGISPAQASPAATTGPSPASVPAAASVVPSPLARPAVRQAERTSSSPPSSTVSAERNSPISNVSGQHTDTTNSPPSIPNPQPTPTNPPAVPNLNAVLLYQQQLINVLLAQQNLQKQKENLERMTGGNGDVFNTINQQLSLVSALTNQMNTSNMPSTSGAAATATATANVNVNIRLPKVEEDLDMVTEVKPPVGLPAPKAIKLSSDKAFASFAAGEDPKAKVAEALEKFYEDSKHVPNDVLKERIKMLENIRDQWAAEN